MLDSCEELSVFVGYFGGWRNVPAIGSIGGLLSRWASRRCFHIRSG